MMQSDTTVHPALGLCIVVTTTPRAVRVKAEHLTRIDKARSFGDHCKFSRRSGMRHRVIVAPVNTNAARRERQVAVGGRLLRESQHSDHRKCYRLKPPAGSDSELTQSWMTAPASSSDSGSHPLSPPLP